jgi:hypothetical protein
MSVQGPLNVQYCITNNSGNITCQYVLHCIKIFKYTPVVGMIQNYLTFELFPITLEGYSIQFNSFISLKPWNGTRGAYKIHLHVYNSRGKQKDSLEKQTTLLIFRIKKYTFFVNISSYFFLFCV